MTDGHEREAVTESSSNTSSSSKTSPPADRREFLKGAGLGAVAGASYGKFGLAPITPAAADPIAPPKMSAEKWWPSKWGADDQAGASNHITPAKVLETACPEDGNKTQTHATGARISACPSEVDQGRQDLQARARL
jgi:hypothetical protein